MRQSLALVWLAVCGLMLHSANGLYIPDEFDNALAAMSEDDVILKHYINNEASRAELEAAFSDAKLQHDIIKNLGKEKAHNGELALLKRVLVQAFEELIQEMKNALGITDEAQRALHHHFKSMRSSSLF